MSEAPVSCPPKVHRDKCGVDATYVRPVEAPWLFRLEREPEWVTWEIDEKNNDYVDRIWAVRGTAFPKVRQPVIGASPISATSRTKEHRRAC